jgi:hypothetical protein
LRVPKDIKEIASKWLTEKAPEDRGRELFYSRFWNDSDQIFEAEKELHRQIHLLSLLCNEKIEREDLIFLASSILSDIICYLNSGSVPLNDRDRVYLSEQQNFLNWILGEIINCS